MMHYGASVIADLRESARLARSVRVLVTGTGLLLVISLPWTWFGRDTLSSLGIPWTSLVACLFIATAFTYVAFFIRPRENEARLPHLIASPWTYCALLAIWALCSVGWSSLPEESLRWAIQFSAVLLAFWLLHLTMPPNVTWYLSAYVISSGIVSALGLYLTLTGNANRAQFLGALDANTAVGMFLIGMAASVTLVCSNNRRLRWLGYFTLPLFIGVVAASGSRAGFLGLVLLIVTTVACGITSRLPKRRLLIVAAITLGTALVGLVFVRMSNYSFRGLNIMSALSDDTGRVTVWREYLRMWPQWWPEGLGAGIDYQLFQHNGMGPLDTHNVALQALVQLGIPGALLGCIALVLFVRSALLEPNRTVALMMLAGIFPLVLTAGVLSLAVAWFPAALATTRLPETKARSCVADTKIQAR